ncbi:YhzD family protein [Indiicoccus explosivorum]|uniref:YhzD family protein n=1 Tax=Indiicoccus explosivorum TaxID=1917864 RepID=UPI000B44910E|nr:YhzD family protein [Indiicoccus explosivorum]
MRTYKATSFDRTGKLIFDETFTAPDDSEAQEIGRKMFEENDLLHQTHRLASPEGKLLLFHS